MSEQQKKSRTLVGKVVSNKMDKTLVVLITRQERAPVYGKYIRRSTKVHVHDQQGECRPGDLVLITETRPYSKTKNWNIVQVLEKAEEQVL
jgi:small subunit ribosomal protein S17